jgi:hypothetical protein
MRTFSVLFALCSIVPHCYGQVSIADSAWDAFRASNYARAIEFSDKCIHEYANAAVELESKLEFDHAPEPQIGVASAEQRGDILKRGPLNGTGACYFIKGRSSEHLNRNKDANAAYTAGCRLRYARVWDSKGWFWSSAEEMCSRLRTANRGASSYATASDHVLQDQQMRQTPKSRKRSDSANGVSTYELAGAQFEKIAHDAEQERKYGQAASALIDAARSYEAAATTDGAQGDHAKSVYRSAIQFAKQAQDVRLQNLATNNLSVLLLDQGKSGEALDVVNNFALQKEESEELAIYLFNYGRILELNNYQAQAYQKYMSAYSTNPTFSRAFDSALGLLTRNSVPVDDNAVGLIRSALETSCTEPLHAAIRQLIEKSSSEARSRQLVQTLAGCYLAQGTTRTKFGSQDADFLRNVAHRSSGLDDLVQGLFSAYSGQISESPGTAAEKFSAWLSNEWPRNKFSALLKMIGDQDEESGGDRDALARYGAAWSISRQPVYALEFASLLQKHQELDHSGALLDELLESMFMQKGSYYEKEDWPNILRMHVAIGTIYESQGRWGDPYSPRGALFQWQHALEAAQRSGLETQSVAGVHSHLGNCYVRVSKPDLAAKEYLLAAESFVDAGDLPGAEQAANLVQQVGLDKLSTPDRDKFQAVVVATGKCPTCQPSPRPEAPVENATVANAVYAHLNWSSGDHGFNEGAECGANALRGLVQLPAFIGQGLGNTWDRTNMMNAAVEAYRAGHRDAAINAAICSQIHNGQAYNLLSANRNIVENWLATH